MLQELHPFFGFNFINFDQVICDSYLQILSLLVQILGDLPGSELAADHARLLGLFLLHPLQL